MIRRAILLLTIAGLYLAITRSAKNASRIVAEHEEDARWANEGGANAPSTV